MLRVDERIEGLMYGAKPKRRRCCFWGEEVMSSAESEDGSTMFFAFCEGFGFFTTAALPEEFFFCTKFSATLGLERVRFDVVSSCFPIVLELHFLFLFDCMLEFE